MERIMPRRKNLSSSFHTFLGICLISGASALQCLSSTDMQHNYPLDNRRFLMSFDTTIKTINCSLGENACEEVQLILRIGRNALSVTHRGCAAKDPPAGTESTTTGDQHYSIQSSVSHCFHDLCNANLTDVTLPISPDDDEAFGASDSAQCYSGISFDSPEATLDRVRCGKDYNRCYSGRLTVSQGLASLFFHTKTCKPQANCTVALNQTFGTVKILSESNSCCEGNYCNRRETATRLPNEGSLIPTVDSSSKGSDHSEIIFPWYSAWANYRDSYLEEKDTWSSDSRILASSSVPLKPAAGASNLAFCFLVILLGCMNLGISW